MNKRKSLFLNSLLSLAALLMLASASHASGRLVMHEFMIPASEPGIKLYVRNKHLPGTKTFRPDNVVLFVHGAISPSETTFDLPFNGLSWMDDLANHGFDVYLVDVRGYGKSSRPVAMAAPPADNPPQVRTITAVQDLGTAVDFILQRRQISSLNVIGWSWGTAISALYTTQHNEKVNRLVLYAPIWLRDQKASAKKPKPLGAYRYVKPEKVMKFLLKGAPAGKELMPVSWQKHWIQASYTSDPEGYRASPKYVRAPNGVKLDRREYWMSGKPLYDPADIRRPTLIILGAWDAITPTKLAKAIYAKLDNAKPKHLVILNEGTHGLMMQNNRMEMFSDVQKFLQHTQK